MTVSKRTELDRIATGVFNVVKDISSFKLPVTASATIGTALAVIPGVHINPEIIISAVAGIGVGTALLNKIVAQVEADITAAKAVVPAKVAVVVPPAEVPPAPVVVAPEPVVVEPTPATVVAPLTPAQGTGA